MRSYLIAAGALGFVAFWGSENLFWSAPQPGVTPLELVLTWLVYSGCAAAALTAVLVTGVQGWRAAFLGGAVLGWLVEGVVVGTMYAAFPFQVVWTPLAWHALVTGVLVIGLGRAAPGWSAARRWSAWAALGVAGGLWASYWPGERGTMPGLGATAVYLFGVGLLVPFAQLALDRVGTVTPPRRAVLWAAPTLLALVWLAEVAVTLSPLYLSLPVLLAGTGWVMRRLGNDTGGGLAFGRPSGLRRHGAFLIAPALAVLVANGAWNLAPEGLPANVVVALVTVPVSLGLLTRLALQARRSGSRSGGDRHHDPGPLERIDPRALREPQSPQ
jgi:hypothetical protein